MPTILCIETATTNCSVAVGINGEVIALKEDYSKSFSHAERLHLFIQEILAENNLHLSSLDAIAISKGPGSYTGLRIGVSTAKGLCFALGIPLISIPTLTALARQVSGRGWVAPMLDARRMEVYTAVFSQNMTQVTPTSASILDESSFKEFLDKGEVTFIGSGVEKFKEICHHPNAVFVENKLPSAKEMLPLAIERYKKSDFEDVAYFEPYYLKDFIAG